MACLRPNFPTMTDASAPSPSLNGSLRSTSSCLNGNGLDGKADGKVRIEVHEARMGLLKAMRQLVAPRFSSKPIDMEDYFSASNGSFAFSSDAGSTAGANSAPTPTQDFRNALISSSNLTSGERSYLENLLQSDDLDSIRRASKRLSDKELFPPAEDPPEGGNATNHKTILRRDSEVQQHLFRLHEKTTVKPSVMLKRMSFNESRVHPDPPCNGDDVNSIMHANNDADDDEQSWKESDDESPQPEEPLAVSNRVKKWNPFADVNSWIDGNQGVEVDNDGQPEIPSPTSNPFKILGTSADDTSCHPHVLSPPLMEGLQSFMPESLHENHYWLKFSLVRDGPNLMTILRHCRASTNTVLAIETTDGNVFGSYTSQPWRLSSRGYYGTADSFVWRMRRSRNEPCDSIVEQALMESKIDVFPFTCRNNKVQYCTNECVCLGDGEVADMSAKGTHYGHAIYLDGTLGSGSTSNSETFGNPCLIDSDLRGKEFTVANIELWSMTSHSSIASAERAELRTLFLEEGRHMNGNLNLLEILVGGPV